MSTNDSNPVERKQIIDFYENKIKALKKILEQTEEMNTTLLQENETLMKEISQLKRRLNSMSKTAEKLKGQEHTATKIKELLMEQTSAVQEDRATLRRENIQLQSTIEGLQKKLAVLEDKLARHSTLEKNLKDAKRELAEKAAEIEDLQKQLLELEKDNEELQAKAEEIQMEMEKITEMKVAARSIKDSTISDQDKSFEEDSYGIEFVEKDISIKTEFEYCKNFIYVSDVYTQTDIQNCHAMTQTSPAMNLRHEEDSRLKVVHVSTSCFQIAPRKITHMPLRGENLQASSIFLNTPCEKELSVDNDFGNGLYVPPVEEISPALKSFRSEVQLDVFFTREAATQTGFLPPSPHRPLKLNSRRLDDSSCHTSQEGSINRITQCRPESLVRCASALLMIFLQIFSLLVTVSSFPIILLLLLVSYRTSLVLLQAMNEDCSFTVCDIIPRAVKEMAGEGMYLYYPYGPPPI